MDVTYLEFLCSPGAALAHLPHHLATAPAGTFPWPGEQFHLLLDATSGADHSNASPGSPDLSPAALPVTFNQRNHIAHLQSTGRSVWIGAVIQHERLATLPAPDLAALLHDLLATHDALRCVISTTAGNPVQLLYPASALRVDVTPAATPTPEPAPEEAEALPNPVATARALEDAISAHINPLVTPGVFAARTQDCLLLAIDHVHVDMLSIDILSRWITARLDAPHDGPREEPATPALSYADALAARAEKEAAAWDPTLAQQQWGRFLELTGQKIPGFPADLGVVAQEPISPKHALITFPDEDPAHELGFAEVLEEMATASGQQLRTLIPMHTRGKPGTPMHDVVGWFVGNAPVVAGAGESARDWLRLAIRGEALSIERVLTEFTPGFAEASLFMVSYLDFTKRAGSTDSASSTGRVHYISSTTAVDSVQLWFSRTASGLHCRVRYPDTPKAEAAVRAITNFAGARWTTAQ